MHACVGMCVRKPNVDTGQLPQSLLQIALNTVLTDLARLADRCVFASLALEFQVFTWSFRGEKGAGDLELGPQDFITSSLPIEPSP